jgi:hypothetical protein
MSVQQYAQLCHRTARPVGQYHLHRRRRPPRRKHRVVAGADAETHANAPVLETPLARARRHIDAVTGRPSANAPANTCGHAATPTQAYRQWIARLRSRLPRTLAARWRMDQRRWLPESARQRQHSGTTMMIIALNCHDCLTLHGGELSCSHIRCAWPGSPYCGTGDVTAADAQAARARARTTAFASIIWVRVRFQKRKLHSAA